MLEVFRNPSKHKHNGGSKNLWEVSKVFREILGKYHGLPKNPSKIY